MANSEADFRSELIKSARQTKDVQALSINDKFIVGYPDVYIKHPRYPQSFWLELKFERSKEPRNVIQMGGRLSAMQRVFLKNHQRAGGYAAWVVCDRIGGPGRRPFWRILAGVDPDAQHTTVMDTVANKAFAVDYWDVDKLLEFIAIKMEARWKKTQKD